MNKGYHDYFKNKDLVNNYFEIGRLLVEAQGGEERAKYGNGLIKGMDLVATVKPYNDDNKYMSKDHSKEKIGEKCTIYLEKMVKLCKDNNIKLLLIEIPSAESWSKDLSDKTQEFANENNLEFIDMNLNYKDFGFDWKTDSADAGDHLNVYGAEKVSKYLGKIIQEKYNIPNRKNDEQYSQWYEDSKIYNTDKEKLIHEEKK